MQLLKLSVSLSGSSNVTKVVIGGNELLECITLASMQDNASATGLSLPLIVSNIIGKLGNEIKMMDLAWCQFT